MIIDWIDDDRSRLYPLFDTFKTGRAVIFPALSQYRGQIWVDSIDSPTVAKFRLNILNFFAGNSNSLFAKEILRTIEPMQPLFVPDDWIDFLEEEWGDRLGKQKRTRMSPDSLDLEYLRELRDRLPKEYKLERVDLETAKRLDKRKHVHIGLYYDGSDDFVENGIGFCIKHDDKVISIASTYTPHTDKFEIQVDTIDDPRYRRKGLATFVCAALMVYALENEIVPHWDAATETSVKLALKLGYTEPYEWNVFYLKPPPED